MDVGEEMSFLVVGTTGRVHAKHRDMAKERPRKFMEAAQK
jgi:hypothetical protein